MVLYKGEFEQRKNFGEFLNTRGLTGYGAEIGTHLGEFAEELLTTWRTKGLTCIDPWCDYEGYTAESAFLWGEGTRDDHFRQATKRLSRFGRQANLVRSMSIDAARMFSDRAFDFVYIDGDHRSVSVYQDLHAWWPKVGPGGILAGHDFILPGYRDDHWERDTQSALFAFASFHGLDIHLVTEEHPAPWSYYMIKEVV